MGDIMKFQWKYGVAFITLLVAEVLIALFFIHDTFIRPYIGDILVVILMYTLIRSFTEKPTRYLPIYLFLFAGGVELLQYFKWVEILGLHKNQVMGIIMGTTFDMKDIGCYFIATILLLIWESSQSKKNGY